MKDVFKQTAALVALCLPVFLLGVGTAQPAAAHGSHAKDACGEATLYCPATKNNVLTKTLQDFKGPTLAAEVLKPVVPPQATAGNAKVRTVTYDVTTRGAITADFNQFKTLVGETLNDNRGWSRLGVTFSQVSSGGQFTVVLSEASQVPSFSSGCDAVYSCTVGRYVIINQDRWVGATDSWNAAGGSLRDYRHMVVNHETGHWLGHGHRGCGGAGQPAPVMQQQSIDLQGCVFNPWPLSNELFAPTLGL